MAFIEGDRRLTYAEWDWLSDRAAFSFWSEGLRPGDVVALQLQPGITYPIAYLGAAKIGCVTAGINPRLAPPEIDAILESSLARALVTDRAMEQEPGLFTPEGLIRPGAAPPSVDISPSDPAAIVYTSGTTGRPAGAVFTFGALDAVRRIERTIEDDHPRGLQGIPMAHMGFMTKIASYIERVSCAVIVQRWSAREALDLISSEQLTSIGGVPTQLAQMLDERVQGTLGPLRKVTIGGAPASPELIRRIQERFGVPVFVRYSCTELALCTATRADDPDEVVAGTVGRPLPEIDLTILSPDADGIGEIAARSPAMFSGYWCNDDATRACVDEHGYFHTGDLGRIDATGNLHLTGRLKEMYIRGGYNVYPVEVEDVLHANPAVALAAVLGVPDELLGERGMAFVVPRDPKDPPAIEDLKAHVARALARFKVPDAIEFRGSLPLTPMFKVDKRALLEELGGR